MGVLGASNKHGQSLPWSRGLVDLAYQEIDDIIKMIYKLFLF